MNTTFTIPEKYISRIQAAFDVKTVEEFRSKIINVVRDTVKQYEEDIAVREAAEGIIVEEDLIQ